MRATVTPPEYNTDGYGLFRCIWVLMWLYLAYLGYGEVPVYIGLAGHFGVRIVARLLKFVVPVAFVALLGFISSMYLMYLSVHLCGWGCFWLLVFSFLWVKVTHYPSGALKSVETGVCQAGFWDR